MISFPALAIYAGLMTSVALAATWAAIALSRRAEQAAAISRQLSKMYVEQSVELADKHLEFVQKDREFYAVNFFADAIITEASKIWVEKGGK